MIGVVLVERLSGPGVAGLVGDRVYPVDLPSGTVLPAVAWQVIDERRARGARSDPGLVRSHVQLTVIGSGYLVAHQVAAEIRQALSRFRGDISGIRVFDVLDDGCRDMTDDGGAPHMVAMDWVFHWKEKA